MKENRGDFFLFILALGITLIAFSFVATLPGVLSFIESKARLGRAIDGDLLFWFQDLRWKSLVLGILLCVIWLSRRFYGAKIGSYLKLSLSEESVSPANKTLQLLVVSFLSLFVELLIIRWLSTEMRVFAYFKNVPLISCFLGLGIGAVLWENKKEISFSSFPFWFCLFGLTASFIGPRMIFLNPAGAEDYVWGIGAASSLLAQAFAAVIFFGIFLFVFVWNTQLFVFLGYLVGREMSRFPALRAYSINVMGSLLGIWVFTAISHFSLPPAFWFGTALLFFLWVIRKNKPALIVMSVISILFVGYVAAKKEPNTVVWSPYYKIELVPTFIQSQTTNEQVLQGYMLKVNEDNHQTGVNFSEEFLSKYGLEETEGKFVIEAPFSIKPVKKALIVGSGLGNDVAAALRRGVEEIDAVEIDPMILKLGHRLHPENPYGSAHVKAINDDARSYFKKAPQDSYDVVVFALLDSHTQFASMSNLRLDNYVYTVESLKDAKELLKSGGLLTITFTSDAQKIWIGPRFHQMLTEAFGREPIALDYHRTTFLIGKDFDLEATLLSQDVWNKILTERRISYAKEGVIPATDDWPFLYLKEKKIPVIYLVMIALLAIVSLLFCKGILADLGSFNGYFFFMGWAFLLLETKSIAQLALTFGTTWMVNAIVFTGILVLILFANLLVSFFKPKKVETWYTLLFFSLILNYFYNVGGMGALPFAAKAVLSTFVVMLPIFFASIIFAMMFEKTTTIAGAFGWNLLGTVVGGLSEYLSLAIGIKSLALLAMAVYLVSYFLLKKERAFVLAR